MTINSICKSVEKALEDYSLVRSPEGMTISDSEAVRMITGDVDNPHGVLSIMTIPTVELCRLSTGRVDVWGISRADGSREVEVLYDDKEVLRETVSPEGTRRIRHYEGGEWEYIIGKQLWFSYPQ